MKKEDLKVGDKIIQTTNGAGGWLPLTITDIKDGIIGMGGYGCLIETVGVHHKYIKEDGTLEDIE